MAQAQLQLGGILDIATGDEIRAVGDDVVRRLTRLDPRPIYRPQPATPQPPGAVTGQVTIIDCGGPEPGRVWDIRQLAIVGADDSNAYASLSPSTTVAATSAGSVSLPAGAAITGFTITTQTIAAPVSGLVTVTGGANGTMNYELNMPVGGGSGLNITFPQPVPPLTPATTITVNVPAIALGAAYAITVYGQIEGAWYKSMSNQPGLAQLLVARRAVPSAINPASSESLFLHPGERLVAQVYGLVTGQGVLAIAQIAEWPEGSMESRRI